MICKVVRKIFDSAKKFLEKYFAPCYSGCEIDF